MSKIKRLPYTFQEALGYGGHKVDIEKALKIVERVGVNVISDLGKTPLMVASELGNETLVKYILKEAPDVDYKSVDAHDITALLVACSNRRLNCITLLLDAGADIEQTHPYHTALSIVFINTFSDPLPSAKYLISKGAKITDTFIEMGMSWDSDKFVSFLEEENIPFKRNLIPKKEIIIEEIEDKIDTNIDIVELHIVVNKMNYDKTAKVVWQKLVPSSGQASSIQGELLRALEKLRDEAQRNGNVNFNNNCHRILVNFLKLYLLDKKVFTKEQINNNKIDLREISKKTMPYTDDDVYDRLTKSVIDWYINNPEQIVYPKNEDLYC